MVRIKRITLWQTIVDGIVADYKRLDKACSAAIEAGTMDVHGKLFDAIWRSFQGMLERIDEDGWINWFIYENEFGKKEMKAKGCGKKGIRKIKTSRQLAELIVESEDYSNQNETIRK